MIFHCFSGDSGNDAKRCVDAGYVLSFAGTVTFRNAPALREAAGRARWTSMLVETDAPFLTPHPFRGRPNEPYCAAYTVRALAQLRSVSRVRSLCSLRDTPNGCSVWTGRRSSWHGVRLEITPSCDEWHVFSRGCLRNQPEPVTVP